MQKRCYGCMKLKEQSPVCELCGYNENVPNYPHQLPVGTVLYGQYTVGKVLGQGGFGITYIGWDNSLETPVAIKEYYPASFVNRDCGMTLNVSCNGEGAEGLFAHNRERFLKEAKILAKLSSVPGIVRVQNLFAENNTAYIVMEYVEGIDLKHYIRMQNRVLTVQEMFHVLRPVMYALSKVHEAELVHRDISPDNIMIQKDGSAKLLDFGAAREVENADVNTDLPQSTEAILKHGFAPMEQYRRRGSLGPWTDVYALCATMYYCMTGKVPNSAPERVMGDDNVNWRQIPGLSEQQIQTLEKGLALMPENRIRTMRELHNGLFGQTATGFTQVQKEEPKKEPEKKPEKKAEKKPDYPTHTVSLEAEEPIPVVMETKKKKKSPIGLIAAALAIVAAVGVFALKPKGDGDVAPTDKPVLSETEPAIVVTLSEEEKQYLAAEELEAAGEYGKAAIAFGKLGDYADARERSFGLWDQVAHRDTIADGEIAVKDDGTVVETGASWRRIPAVHRADGVYVAETSHWSDIIAIDGNMGLKRDGTVLTTGNCDVSGWYDIVAISGSMGLRMDGTVLYPRVENDRNDTANAISQWTDMVAVCQADYCVGLQSDGTVITYHSQGEPLDLSHWSDIVAIDTARDIIIGLRADGTVLTTDDTLDVSGWTDIVDIAIESYFEWSGYQTHVAGLRSDGTVVATGSNRYQQCEVSEWRDVVAISTGMMSTVGLRSDGTVVATGYNVYGECRDASAWTDILLPSQGSIFVPAENADRDIPQNTETEPETVAFSDEMILAPEKTDIMLSMYYQYELKLKNGLTADQVQWESKNPEIVSVDETGMITALKKGVTEILITYGDQTATVTVRVH